MRFPDALSRASVSGLWSMTCPLSLSQELSHVLCAEVGRGDKARWEGRSARPYSLLLRQATDLRPSLFWQTHASSGTGSMRLRRRCSRYTFFVFFHRCLEITACFQLLNCLFNCLLGTAALTSYGPGEEWCQVQIDSHACVAFSNERK